MPPAMQALFERVTTIADAVGVAVPEQLRDPQRPQDGPRAGMGDPPGAPMTNAPPHLVGAPGAHWVIERGGAYWRWSWLDARWQPTEPPDGAPQQAPDGWVHWVEGVDGGWTQAGSGPEGTPWPTPAPVG